MYSICAHIFESGLQIVVVKKKKNRAGKHLLWHQSIILSFGCGDDHYCVYFHYVICNLPGYMQIFSCDQAALRTPPSFFISVRLSCLSVTPFSLCSSHRIIMEVSGVITIGKSDVHAKGQGQSSKVKVTEVKTQSSFRTVTLVWIHTWLRNEAQTLK